MDRPTSLFWWVACCCVVTLTVAGPPHSHKQDHQNRERETDGAFSPRDHSHFANGDHRMEFDHEAILGSKDEAEEFDHLSPAVAKERLKILAEKMDTNHDGFVDRGELTQWVLNSFRMLTEEEAQERLEDADANEDGTMTWEEHVAETFGFFKENELEDKEQLAEEMKMMEEDKELFEAADINGDGSLDKSEMPAFSNPEEFDHMHEVLYRQTMKKRDVNKDGFIDFNEYLADSRGREPVPNSESYIAEKDKFDHDYDVDRDGNLNRKEVLAWLIPDKWEVAENEADHLITSSDINLDGKLSVQEILDHHEIFVGSEATDFGNHLHNPHKFNDEL